MQSRQMTMRPIGLLPLAAALATLACGDARADDPTPWYVGASQSFTHDSNVYRLADGVAPVDGHGRGDNYWSSGLLGGFDQPIGRQRFYGAANVQYNKYQEHDLSNTSYGVNAGWDWATIEKLSGNLNASANQSLASLNGNGTAQSNNDRATVRTEQIATTVRWGGVGRLGLEGSYGHSRVLYSQPSGNSAGANNDSTGDTASLGVNYNLNPDLRVGTAVRFVHSVVLNGLAVPNSSPIAYEDSVSNSRNLDLTVDWQSTAKTGITSRLSWTRLNYSGASNQSFSGLTGSFSGRYAPTAKLSFTAAYNRDAGTNGSFFNVVTTTPNNQPITFLSEGSQVTDSYSFGAGYAATAKINVNAGYEYRNAKISNAFAGNTVSEYNDKFRTARLGAGYAITRSVQLSCNLSHEKRDVSSVPGFAYSANVIGCSASFTLR